MYKAYCVHLVFEQIENIEITKFIELAPLMYTI